MAGKQAWDAADAQAAPSGFDVTCTIGRVEFSELSEHSPLVAAFILIAQHGASGEFSFPGEEGKLIYVDVTYPS